MPELQSLSSSYASLRNRVREVLVLGQQQIEAERVRTYWETGKVIGDYLSRYKTRGEHYGQEVVLKLAEDLDLSETLLRRCVQFAQTFKIPAGRHESSPNLSWTHYRALITVGDERKRRQLLDRAVKSQWTSEALEREIKKVNALIRESSNGGVETSYEPLTPRKGTPYTYRLVRPEKINRGRAELRIDLGFSCFKEAAMEGIDGLKAGDMCESIWVRGDTYRLKKAAARTEQDLYTYYAEIERVVDGDTIIAHVDLGFGITTRQYLRLSGIDCPELYTAEGKKAKKFVESELSRVAFVTICSTKSDKYDRYLADVFYAVKGKEQFLNNELLSHKLAIRV